MHQTQIHRIFHQSGQKQLYEHQGGAGMGALQRVAQKDACHAVGAVDDDAEPGEIRPKPREVRDVVRADVEHPHASWRLRGARCRCGGNGLFKRSQARVVADGNGLPA